MSTTADRSGGPGPDASSAARQPSLKRAVVLMTGSSFLVPLAGLVTAPILARGLSADGRGEFAAAIAPAVLMLAVATIGLPEALTFRLARRPQDTRRALRAASSVTLLLGVVCALATWLALPYLSDGNHELGRFILLATVVTVPALAGNTLRGAASGLQRWSSIALERFLLTGLRVVAFGGLYLTGNLTVGSAVVVAVALPLVAALVYVPILLRPPDAAPVDVEAGTEAGTEAGSTGPLLRPLLSFGSRVWLGSVAEMFLARASQLFMVPLSSARDLGLYSVAITVSDVPIIVSLAIQSALFGVNSRARDAGKIALTSRFTLLIGAVGCLGLGALLPFLIAPLFGSEFAGAVVPTWILLAAAFVSIPGTIAASGLSAWGRPGLRSLGLALTLVVNLVAFFVLVPRAGVVGGCLAGLISQLFMTVFIVGHACRVIGLRPADLLVVRGSDVARLWREGRGALRSLARTRST